MKQINLPEFSVVVVISKDEDKRLKFIKHHFTHQEYFQVKHLALAIEERVKVAKLTVISLREVKDPVCEAAVRMAKRYYCVPVVIMLDPIDSQELKNNKKTHKEAAKHINRNTQTTIKINSNENRVKNKADTIKDTELESREENRVIGQVMSGPTPKQIRDDFEVSLRKRGFEEVYLLDDEDNTNQHVLFNRTTLRNNQLNNHGPFDIIGDVHGCYDELCELLEKLGYELDTKKAIAYSTMQRKAVFCGDLVDRGPKVTKVLRLVMNMVKEKQAYCVLGNHDGKLLRKLKGSNVQVIHGLEVTLEQLDQESHTFREEVKEFLEGLVSHYVFDEGKLVVAHAGLKEKMHGRETKKVRDLAMFGETTGKLDEYGLPQRLNWSEKYRGEAFVAYGHTPRIEPKLENHTINIDTGCVYGGKLTAFRYPEQEVVSVKAKATYYESTRPLGE